MRRSNLPQQNRILVHNLQEFSAQNVLESIIPSDSVWLQPLANATNQL